MIVLYISSVFQPQRKEFLLYKGNVPLELVKEFETSVVVSVYLPIFLVMQAGMEGSFISMGRLYSAMYCGGILIF